MNLRLILVAACAFAAHLQGQQMRPDFAKLAVTPLCAAAAEFARTNHLPIEGIEPVGPTDRLNPGDCITALLTLFEKGGHQRQWLLWHTAAELTPEEKAGAAKPPMVLYVGAGEKVEFSRSTVPVILRLVGPFAEAPGRRPKVRDQTARLSVNPDFLGLGLEEAAAATYRIVQDHLHGQLGVRARPFTEGEIADGKKAIAALRLSLKEQRAIAGANLALDSYTELVQQTPGLDELFYKVVKPPSVWSVLWHLGVKVSLELETQYVTPIQPVLWQLPPEAPYYTFPLALRVNDQPALMTTLVVAPPRPPLLGSAGIVGMLAENPIDRETFLLLRIISAHHHASSPGQKVYPTAGVNSAQ